jgi:DNA adenine methylase
MNKDLLKLSKIDLIAKCKELNIKGYSNKTKNEIINMISSKNNVINSDENNSVLTKVKPVFKPKTTLAPLVKWSGGKSDEIKLFEDFIPKEYDTYLEPFIGGGALFFKLAPKKGVISDVHNELIDLYKSIKDGYANDIYNYMEIHPNEEEEYYRVRDSEVETSLDNAKRFYYLRKTCFRGMLRYNKKGKFNIPYGRYGTINYEDLKDKRYEELLKRTEIFNTSFETIFRDYNNENNFMFLDPPYDSEFTDYGYCQFDKSKHELLAKCFKETKIKCLMIIGKTEFIENLYKDYIVGEYDKSYKFKLYDGRIGDDINTQHLVIKNW